MYRFIRTATVRTAAAMPTAVKFGGEITAYVNKRYSTNMRFGVEMYGSPKVHWHFESDSLDQMQKLNAELMHDRDYLGLLERYKDTWVDGSMKDMLVAFAS